ncbi:MAG TPA: HAD-IA family hydrolase [Gammaproteobacteria bacterium]|nr:HAD-IA family hydrolase [Gammaproteobacteria bacterium]
MRKYLVFDLDDTLYPEREYVLSGFRAVSEYISNTYGVGGVYELAVGYLNQGIRGDIFDRCLETLFGRSEKFLVAKLVNVYRNHNPNITFFPDAHQLLKVHAQSTPIAIITDGYAEAQRKKILALGLASIARKIIVTDDWGRQFWKPNVRGYLEIEKFFDASPDECVYVGDNPLKDFVTPKQRGWLTIQINRVGGEYGSQQVPDKYRADTVVDDLSTIAERFIDYQ